MILIRRMILKNWKKKIKKNLLGKYIACMKGAKEGSKEYQALYEGVHALLETKRGF